jgi:cytochrome c peroxidase
MPASTSTWTPGETSRGVGDQIGKRNAPSLLKAMFYKSMFWDGREATLEEQALLPILNPVEMGQKDRKDVIACGVGLVRFVLAFAPSSSLGLEGRRLHAN